MKKILTVIILLSFAGCNRAPDKVIIHDTIRAIDSIYYTDNIPNERYFLISYSTRQKVNANNISEGSTWFSCTNGFPSKKSIDSIVYDGLTLKSSCYQGIIIKDIYEFKSRSDYEDFTHNYIGNSKSIKTHKSCQPLTQTDLHYIP